MYTSVLICLYLCLFVCASTPGTAAAGTDYLLHTEPLSFYYDEAETILVVDIFDNLDADSDKTFSLKLDTVTGEGAALGGSTGIVITILENGRLCFSQNRHIGQYK